MRFLKIAILLLLLSPTSHALPADGWLKGVPFAVPVECQWQGSLGSRADAETQVYLDLMRRAFALSVRHLPSEPSKNLFQWPNAATELSQRKVVVVLTDQAPQINGK